MLGAGIAGLIYSLFPELFGHSVDLKSILIVGALIGGGLHGLIDGAIQAFFGPPARWVSFYSSLLNITMLFRLGVITEQRRQELVGELVKKYFLGRNPPKPRGGRRN